MNATPAYMPAAMMDHHLCNSLESRMRRKLQVRFGEGRLEKEPIDEHTDRPPRWPPTPQSPNIPLASTKSEPSSKDLRQIPGVTPRLETRVYACRSVRTGRREPGHRRQE